MPRIKATCNFLMHIWISMLYVLFEHAYKTYHLLFVICLGLMRAVRRYHKTYCVLFVLCLGLTRRVIRMAQRVERLTWTVSRRPPFAATWCRCWAWRSLARSAPPRRQTWGTGAAPPHRQTTSTPTPTNRAHRRHYRQLGKLRWCMISLHSHYLANGVSLGHYVELGKLSWCMIAGEHSHCLANNGVSSAAVWLFENSSQPWHCNALW